MREFLTSTAPFWVAIFLIVCAALFGLILFADDYVQRFDEREERRRQRAIYDAEGL